MQIFTEDLNQIDMSGEAVASLNDTETFVYLMFTNLERITYVSVETSEDVTSVEFVFYNNDWVEVVRILFIPSALELQI